MNKLIQRAFWCIAASAAVLPASALIVIDDFTSGDTSLSVQLGGDTAFGYGSMVGGNRYSLILMESNGFNLDYSLDIMSDVLSLSSKPQVDGVAAIHYGLADNNGSVVLNDLNLDLSGESWFEIDVLSNDQDAVFTIELRSNSGATVASSMQAIPGGMVNSVQTYQWNFTDFGGIDFSDIDQIVLTLDSSESGDVTIGEFRAVPEPGTMAVLGAGLATVLVSRRRRRS